jgi:hypothetical protein
MIEGFVQARQAYYRHKSSLGGEIQRLVEDAENGVKRVISTYSDGHSVGPQGTPPMLPSPASIVSANSANSTPASHAEGTPRSIDLPSDILPVVGQSSTDLQLPPRMMDRLSKQWKSGKPIPTAAHSEISRVTVGVQVGVVESLQDASNDLLSSGQSMKSAQLLLNLGVVSREFPITFARMIHSTLAPNEEHEPDLEDEEGELYWPTQCIGGEGLGWVCLMGKAMINEFGKRYDYRGIDGVIPKQGNPVSFAR